MEFLSGVFSNEGQEQYSAPSLEVTIPDEALQSVNSKTQLEKLELWADMLDISTNSPAFTSVLKNQIVQDLQIGLEESGNSLSSIDFSDAEFRGPIIAQAIETFYREYPVEFLFFASTQPVIVINGIAIHGISDSVSRYNLEPLEKQYYAHIADNLENYTDFEKISEISDREKDYFETIFGEIGNPATRINLFQTLREYGFVTDASYLHEVRSSYDAGYISYPDLVSLERDHGINHFDVLSEYGFSDNLKRFIVFELYPALFEGERGNQQALENIKKLCLFIIDIETTAGINLVNGISTATSYTQVLNEVSSSRKHRRYNSLDTRIRYAAKFYNKPGFEIPERLRKILAAEDVTDEKRREVRIVANDIMQTPGNITREEGVWVKNMWEYNEDGRNMIDFSFEDEMKILLLFFFQKHPNALRDIISGHNPEKAAEQLYDFHHSNAYEDAATNDRMGRKLESYYG